MSETPAGKWADGSPISPNCTIAANNSAVHRDAYGLQVIDADSDATPGVEAQVDHFYTATSPSQYVRLWFRSAVSNGVSKVSLSQIIGTVGQQAIAELTLDFSNGQLVLAGFDANGNYDEATATDALVVGNWHLLEFAVTGVGTANGVRRLWVDGVKQAERTDLNFVGRDIFRMTVGEPWGFTRDFQGTLYFDDVGTGDQALPSTLRVTGPSEQIVAGDCVPLEISLQDSDSHALAATPHAADISLNSNGASGMFFLDAACTISITHLAWVAGSTQGVTYFKAASTGPVTFSAAHADFLTTSVSSNVCATSDCGRLKLNVGCSAVGGMQLDSTLCVLLLAIGLKRRGADGQCRESSEKHLSPLPSKRSIS